MITALCAIPLKDAARVTWINGTCSAVAVNVVEAVAAGMDTLLGVERLVLLLLAMPTARAVGTLCDNNTLQVEAPVAFGVAIALGEQVRLETSTESVKCRAAEDP